MQMTSSINGHLCEYPGVFITCTADATTAVHMPYGQVRPAMTFYR